MDDSSSFIRPLSSLNKCKYAAYPCKYNTHDDIVNAIFKQNILNVSKQILIG